MKTNNYEIYRTNRQIEMTAHILYLVGRLGIANRPEFNLYDLRMLLLKIDFDNMEIALNANS